MALKFWTRMLEWYQRRPSWLRFTVLDPVLIGILLLSGCVLLYRLADPEGSLIFDESYYVQMARVILGWPVLPEHLPENLYSGCDPNSEHPPLAKLIMAAGMSIFADDATGWRLPSVILGLCGVVSVYSIVLSLGGSLTTARLSSFILAFDNLYFVHSRIATLDIYMVSFSLVGVALYFRGRYEFAGLAFGLATVCKINGLLWVFALFLYEGGMAVYRYWVQRSASGEEETELPVGGNWWGLGLAFGFWVTFGFLALGAMDCYFTEFQGPFAHVRFIFGYGTSLSREAGLGPQGAESTPLQWWLNEKVFDYLSVAAGVGEGLTKTVISFRGAMNMYLIALAPFALVQSLVASRRGCRLSFLVFCLFFANYVPMLITWIKVRRICYLFYMLPSLPALAMGCSLVLTSLPTWCRALFVFCTIYTFVYLFPFREALLSQLR